MYRAILLLTFSSLYCVDCLKPFEAILRSYDNSERPVIHGAVVVNVSLVIGSLEVDDVRQTLKISGQLQHIWEDIHLRYPSGDSPVGLQGERWNKMKHHLWLPDITFANTFHPLAPPSGDFLKIEESGKMIWTQHIYVEFPCELDYTDYPVDNHKCKIKLHSMGYDYEELTPRWSIDEAVRYKDAVMGTRFRIKEIHTDSSTVVYIYRSQRQLEATVYLESYSGWSVKHTVFPFVSAVITAYLSFFINVKAVCSRLLVCGIAMVFALVFHDSTYRATPKVPYTMAIEIFTGTCLTFIWAAIAETVGIDVLTHVPGKPHCSPHNSFNEQTELEDDGSARGYTVALWVDRCFRIVYPAMFIIFNSIFWIVYHSTNFYD